MTHKTLPVARNRCSPLVRSTLWLVAGGLALSSCADPQQGARGEAPTARPVVADAEQMRAARALSLGSLPELGADRDPYERAVMCNIAVRKISQRLAQNGALGDAQLVIINRVRAHYDRQVQTLAARAGKTDASLRADRSQQTERLSDPNLAGQTAIGCLRSAAGAIESGQALPSPGVG